MSDRFDIEVDTGADSTLIFEMVDEASGKFIPTDGYTARMQVRPYLHSDIVCDELTTENGRMVFDDMGRLEVTFTNKATDEYTFNEALYDIEVVSPEGKVTRLVQGRIITNHGVTR